MTDDELRAEVERRGLLVEASANDPADGYCVADVRPGFRRYVKDDARVWVWATDLAEQELCRVPDCGRPANCWLHPAA